MWFKNHSKEVQIKATKCLMSWVIENTRYIELGTKFLLSQSEEIVWCYEKESHCSAISIVAYIALCWTDIENVTLLFYVFWMRGRESMTDGRREREEEKEKESGRCRREIAWAECSVLQNDLFSSADVTVREGRTYSYLVLTISQYTADWWEIKAN
jgi:hypothetical protein